MAEVIVHSLEAIDIEQQQANCLVLSRSLQQRLILADRTIELGASVVFPLIRAPYRIAVLHLCGIEHCRGTTEVALRAILAKRF